jgi:hypothetical protein
LRNVNPVFIPISDKNKTQRDKQREIIQNIQMRLSFWTREALITETKLVLPAWARSDSGVRGRGRKKNENQDQKEFRVRGRRKRRRRWR